MSEKILKKSAHQIIYDDSKEYGEKVIYDRVVPKIDGLKPVSRRIIWSAYRAKLLPKNKIKKSTTLVAETLSIHPHGDRSAYEASVRLAQSWKMNGPLIDFTGNLGSIYDSSSYAPYRYTYSKLSELGLKMLEGIGENAVDINPSENDSEFLEPDVLPAKFPSILVNGITGIGFGISSSIAPHNLNRVLDAITSYLDNEDISEKELFEIVGGPEFPTGKTVIMNRSEMEAMYSKGAGKVVMRGDYEIVGEGTSSCSIIFNSVPYNVDLITIINQASSAVEEGSLVGVKGFRNESTKKNCRLVFELDKDAVPSSVLEVLLSKTSLKSTFPVSQYVLIDGKPKLLSLKGIVKEYTKHIRNCLIRESKCKQGVLEEKIHINEGYVIVLSDVDKAIAIIKGSKNKDEASVKLQKAFNLSPQQAGKVLELRLSKLTSMEINSIKELLAKMKVEYDRLEKIITEKDVQNKELSSSLNAQKSSQYENFKTTLVDEIVDGDILAGPKENTTVILTDNGICRVEEGFSGGVSANIVQVLETDTHSKVGVVYSGNRFMTIDVLDIPVVGKNKTEIFGISEPIGIFTNKKPYVALVTEKGVVKKMEAEQFFKTKKTTVFTKLKSKDRILNIAEVEKAACVTLRSGKGLIVEEVAEKGLIGTVYCEEPLGVSDSEAFVRMGDRIKKINFEKIKPSKNKTKGIDLKINLKEGEELIQVFSDKFAFSEIGRLIDLSELTGRPKKIF